MICCVGFPANIEALRMEVCLQCRIINDTASQRLREYFPAPVCNQRDQEGSETFPRPEITGVRRPLTVSRRMMEDPSL